MGSIVQVFLKHALIAALVVGTFATLCERWCIRKTALIYSCVPISFLYLVISTWITRGRGQALAFSKQVWIGSIAYFIFVFAWWSIDTVKIHPAVHVSVALVIWAILFTIIYFTTIHIKNKEKLTTKTLEAVPVFFFCFFWRPSPPQTSIF